MFNSYSSYTALPKDEDADERRANTTGVCASTWLGAAPSRGPAVLALSLAAHALIFLSIVAYVSRHGHSLGSPQPFSQNLYSPAQDTISYQVTTFESGFHGSLYTGSPTPETDARWKELYRVGNSRISKSEAAQLPNKTIAAVAGEDDYLVVISVFHDLHCLDRLRQSLWYFYDDGWNETWNPFTAARPASFAADGLNGIEHLDHCINILRQSLQCFSDVSPYVFQWDEASGEVGAYANVAHTCRNFDDVRNWALDRTYTGTWGREGHRDEQGHCRSGESGACLDS